MVNCGAPLGFPSTVMSDILVMKLIHYRILSVARSSHFITRGKNKSTGKRSIQSGHINDVKHLSGISFLLSDKKIQRHGL